MAPRPVTVTAAVTVSERHVTRPRPPARGCARTGRCRRQRRVRRGRQGSPGRGPERRAVAGSVLAPRPRETPRGRRPSVLGSRSGVGARAGRWPVSARRVSLVSRCRFRTDGPSVRPSVSQRGSFSHCFPWARVPVRPRSRLRVPVRESRSVRAPAAVGGAGAASPRPRLPRTALPSCPGRLRPGSGRVGVGDGPVVFTVAACGWSSPGLSPLRGASHRPQAARCAPARRGVAVGGPACVRLCPRSPRGGGGRGGASSRVVLVALTFGPFPALLSGLLSLLVSGET
ncbi:uncharacterized protein LOC123941224 [Meles meles]|uniref:uncharacterized protein LOC123941224 n=1 Tax=Meles meles TaxID=9662 RepID=UPI001E6A086F|nr:uncharacterized protein LOC123941224 [Meles meles]